MRKRTPFYVTARHMATGADYSRVLYLHSAADASSAMLKYLPRTIRKYSRLVTVAVATPDQLAAHHARLAEAAQ